MIALLLPVPSALAGTNTQEPATAGSAAPQGAAPEAPAANPPGETVTPQTGTPQTGTPQTVTPEAGTPKTGTPEAPAPAPEGREAAPAPRSAPAAESGSPPPERPAGSGGPSRAPVLTRNAEPSRRSPPGSAPAATPGEGQTPQRGMGSLSPEEPRAQPEEDFGRWERSARQCDIQIEEPQDSPPERLPCSGVRLDQQLAGLLSIRFLPAAQDRDTPAHLLLFAGVLQPGSAPMRCSDSRCEPSWPIRVQLSALATSNARTLGLPQARVVQGSCSLESTRVLCTARDREGGRWQATVRW